MKPRVKINTKAHFGEWELGDTGVVDGYCRGGNDIPYAIVILDKNFRFVMVDINQLEQIGSIMKCIDADKLIAESKDEKIRKALVSIVKGIGADSCYFTDNAVSKNEVLAYLERQKDQKPADDKAFEEWIDDWWKHNRVNNPYSYDKGDEIQFDEQGFKNFCCRIRNMYQQKPAGWSEKDEWMIEELCCLVDSYELEEQQPEKIKFWLKSLRPQPRQEWSEEDKKTISFVIDVLRANHPDGFFKTSPAGDIHVTGITVEKLIKKLESLLSRFE